MSAVGIYMIWGVLAVVALAVIAVVWRCIVRLRNRMKSDDPDVIWFGQLGEEAGEDTSIARRIAAGDAGRRRIARVGERWLP